jgi:hypothetical protein
MTTVRPMAAPFVGFLLLAVLALYAAMSLSVAWAPSRASVTTIHRTQSEAPAQTGTALGPAAPLPADAGSVPSEPVAPVVGAGHTTGGGIQRFADAGPGIVDPAASRAMPSCGPKRCLPPLR